jgi:hypothetical protein
VLLVTLPSELETLQPAASFKAEEHEENKPTGSEGDSFLRTSVPATEGEATDGRNETGYENVCDINQLHLLIAQSSVLNKGFGTNIPLHSNFLRILSQIP